jgi:hypothetical protein
LKEVYTVEPREEDRQEPKAAEPREEQTRPRRFRIVKLEERIAPMAGGNRRDNPTSTSFVDPWRC